MSDANKGLSGRKGRVGAMRGLIPLVVIFFVALSAQASAKTYLICIITDCEVRSGNASGCVAQNEVEYVLEYEIGEEELYVSRLKYFTSDIPNCSALENFFGTQMGIQDGMRISIYCAKDNKKPHLGQKHININTITGKIKITEPPNRSPNGHQSREWKGICRKAKPKF